MKFRQTGDDTFQVTIQFTLHPKKTPAHRRFKDILENAAPREAASRVLEALDGCLEHPRSNHRK